MAQTTIRSIRHAYHANPHLGLASWFKEFDCALHQQQYTLCLALLEEIREAGYALHPEEHGYVDSREGALLLCQGISYHLQGEYMLAHQCYEKSRRIYHRLKNEEGEGQVSFALDELRKQQAGKAGDPHLLDLIPTR